MPQRPCRGHARAAGSRRSAPFSAGHGAAVPNLRGCGGTGQRTHMSAEISSCDSYFIRHGVADGDDQSTCVFRQRDHGLVIDVALRGRSLPPMVAVGVAAIRWVPFPAFAPGLPDPQNLARRIVTVVSPSSEGTAFDRFRASAMPCPSAGRPKVISIATTSIGR